jgi:NAD(P)-dependent dehydrogenase (short-subunit alcohol dehydrogenase family)
MVAGGAGTIGTALVEGFIDAGARVAVADLDPSAAPDGVAHTEAADLRSAQACRDAVAASHHALGGIDVFVHCIGINNRKPIEDYSDDEWEAIVSVNLSSAFYTAAAVAPGMRARRDGRIIFFSSVAGRSGHKHHGPYAVTKGGINQLARVMAHEYAEHGVTVNAVAPGYMDTELTRAYLLEHPEERASLLRLIPSRRFGTLDEIVGPVLFLSSRHARFINGQVLYIDGGRTVV